jgi:hypothetical protein
MTEVSAKTDCWLNNCDSASSAVKCFREGHKFTRAAKAVQDNMRA